MKNIGLISARFWVLLFIGLGIIIYLCGVSLSNNIEARIGKTTPINATSISGTRG